MLLLRTRTPSEGKNKEASCLLLVSLMAEDEQSILEQQTRNLEACQTLLNKQGKHLQREIKRS